MTIPTLISVNNQRAWDTASNVFVGKLGKSLSVMNTQNALGGWPTTEAFVSELQKHMKINIIWIHYFYGFLMYNLVGFRCLYIQKYCR